MENHDNEQTKQEYQQHYQLGLGEKEMGRSSSLDGENIEQFINASSRDENTEGIAATTTNDTSTEAKNEMEI